MRMIKATWHGHGWFEFDFDGTRTIVDPFLSDSPTADIGPDEVDVEYILLTHGHGDHFGDTISIGERTGATVIAPNELAVYCGAKGLKNHPMHIGGGYDFPFGRVELTIAHHGSALIGDDGIPIYLGNPCGFIFKVAGKTIYFAGDTGLFLDMKLIGDRNRLDAAFLPIGDNFTMGVEDAVTATDYLKPKVVVPMHFDTWPVIGADLDAFLSGVEKVGVTGIKLEIGGSHTFE
jgi:L-ascorbate metabolism protein UlaG (beta-lactamase superfamily)